MPKSSKSSQGIQSRQKVRAGVRTGAGAEGVNPGNVSQIGGALGTHVMSRSAEVHGAAEPMRTAKPYSTNFGNEKALNVGKGGPGTGRTIHASGSQGRHGEAAQGERRPMSSKDTLAEYGPERGGRKS
jgi:hypothetical protein